MAPGVKVALVSVRHSSENLKRWTLAGWVLMGWEALDARRRRMEADLASSRSDRQMLDFRFEVALDGSSVGDRFDSSLESVETWALSEVASPRALELVRRPSSGVRLGKGMILRRTLNRFLPLTSVAVDKG